jgi:hypothetical protein
MKGMFSSIRRLTNSTRPAIAPIRDRERKTITSTEGQIKRWEEFFEDILNTSTSLTEREEPVRLLPELPISTRFPSKREIIYATKAMKNGKAAGPDNITAEVLKTAHTQQQIFFFRCSTTNVKKRNFLKNGNKGL